MKELREKTELLNRAAKAYYQESREIMSNLEYDRLYEELEQLERETGIVLATSPTINVGYEVLSDLPKERHPSPMLSLDKTKDAAQLADWLGNQRGVLSWKLDGLTIVFTYREGELFKAVTRGNGEIGEVITPNAKAFANVPLRIPFQGELILRGEACIHYSDFEKINGAIGDAGARYKNPRNLCSGSVRQLNSEITAKRNVHFYAFAMVSAADVELETRAAQFQWLADQGFEVVPYRAVTRENLEAQVRWFEDHVEKNDLPSDGLVLIFDDIAYGQSLGATSKFPRDSIAFKWKDETKETTLKEIEWSASRTGLINPVAIFEPVELEGTTVSRASVHNVSILKELHLGIGDKIQVYKANMIIPQIAENLTKSDNLEIPAACPVCGQETRLKKENDAEVLFCPNAGCLAKRIKSLTHFVSRNAMNIDGLSEATLEKFVAKGYIHRLGDLFRLARYRDEITTMEGFGQKSFENLAHALETARKTTPDRLLYSLGIPGIGAANARIIAKACKNKWSRMQAMTEEELAEIYGIGKVMAAAYAAFFAKEENKETVADLLSQLELDEGYEEAGEQALEGKTFVITGSLNHYKNRDALKAAIEELGGKAAGSVSKKTDYLINNDIASGSSKNRKAKELGVPILTEEDFLELAKIEKSKETGEETDAENWKTGQRAAGKNRI